MDSVDIHDFMEDGEELDSVDPRLVNVFRQVITRRDDRDDHTRRLSRESVTIPFKSEATLSYFC